MENMNLRALRKSKHLTQTQMAEMLGYRGKSGYCQLEKGVVRVTVEQARRLAEILEVRPEALFSMLTTPAREEAEPPEELRATSAG